MSSDESCDLRPPPVRSDDDTCCDDTSTAWSLEDDADDAAVAPEETSSRVRSANSTARDVAARRTSTSSNASRLTESE